MTTRALVATALLHAGVDAFLAPALPPACGRATRVHDAGIVMGAPASGLGWQLPAGPAARKHGQAAFAGRRRGVACRMAAEAITMEEANRLPAYSKIGRFKVKGMTASLPLGLLFLLGAIGWALVLTPPIVMAWVFAKWFDPLRRRIVDKVVSLWAWGACLAMLYFPKLQGRENLPGRNEAVMYIPNHTSYLDIFTLSGCIPRSFKYVSKQEILQIPIIGWAMQMAGHIGIKRMDKRSQLQTFKETVGCLQNGNSVVTFAEGTRSDDGRLKSFKKGPIKMAMRAGVKLVPISICNLYKWMPGSAVTPLAVPRNVIVKIHPGIDPEGKTEEEVLQYVYDCVNGGLPEHQKHLGSVSEASE